MTYSKIGNLGVGSVLRSLRRLPAVGLVRGESTRQPWSPKDMSGDSARAATATQRRPWRCTDDSAAWRSERIPPLGEESHPKIGPCAKRCVTKTAPCPTASFKPQLPATTASPHPHCFRLMPSRGQAVGQRDKARLT
jgi:hypothetical protein